MLDFIERSVIKLCKFVSREFCDYGLMLTYYGANCVYIVFISTTIHDIVNFELGLTWDVRAYIAICILPILLISQVRTNKQTERNITTGIRASTVSISDSSTKIFSSVLCAGKHFHRCHFCHHIVLHV